MENSTKRIEEQKDTFSLSRTIEACKQPVEEVEQLLYWAYHVRTAGKVMAVFVLVIGLITGIAGLLTTSSGDTDDLAAIAAIVIIFGTFLSAIIVFMVFQVCAALLEAHARNTHSRAVMVNLTKVQMMQLNAPENHIEADEVRTAIDDPFADPF